MEDPIQFVIALAVFGLAVMVHESAHAWIANLLGDPTGKNLGRISLNPLVHIDLINTILLPLLLLSANLPPLGAAKPVPINPVNFRNPSRGMMISALAGPLSNFLLVIISLALLIVVHFFSPEFIPPRSYNAFFFEQMIIVNVVLGTFNLIPIPPMDGSRALRHFLPDPGKRFLDILESFGFIIIMLLMFTGILSRILTPLVNVILEAIVAILKALL